MKQFVESQFKAALRLALLNRKGLAQFSMTDTHVRWSMYVPLLAYIIYTPFLYLYFGHALEVAAVDIADEFWTGKPIKIYLALLVGWLSNLFIVHKIANMIDRDTSFRQFVVAFNWAVPLQVILMSVAMVFVISDQIPDSVSQMIQAVVVSFSYIYRWFIVKTTLKLGNLPAIGMVFLLALIAEFIVALVMLS